MFPRSQPSPRSGSRPCRARVGIASSKLGQAVELLIEKDVDRDAFWEGWMVPMPIAGRG